MPNRSLTEPAVCGRTCPPCAFRQAIGWSSRGIVHLGTCSRLVPKGSAVCICSEAASSAALSLRPCLPRVALLHILTLEASAGLLTALLRPQLLWQQDAGGLVAGSQLRQLAFCLLLDMAHLHKVLHSLRRLADHGITGLSGLNRSSNVGPPHGSWPWHDAQEALAC